MEIRWIYEEGKSDEVERNLHELTEGEAEIQEIDASGWDEDERWKFYMKELMPLSIQQQKKLKGRVRTHEAGKISFDEGVLIIDGKELHIGEEEILDVLKELSGVEA